MYKTRLEILTDGVFAIVMTLLVLEIRLPEASGILTNGMLWHDLVGLFPDFMSYFASFTILTMYWGSHQAVYHFFIKEIDRILVQFNLLFLAFIAFIPFMAHMVATHFETQLALVLYGVNMLIISTIFIAQFFYAIKAKEVEIDETELDRRTFAQSTIRLFLPIIFTILGIVGSFVSPYLALILFAFPVIFNIIPGSLNFVERTFGFKLPE